MFKNIKFIDNIVKSYSKIDKSSIFRQYVRTSPILNEKKKGQFVDILKTENEKAKKVKLYPGFQTSSEEIQQKLLEEEDSQSIFAKKVIEDFYGLNELEYEKEDEFVSNSNDELLEDDIKEFNVVNAIKLLKSENVQDICCIEIPKEINYADYMIIGSCLSDKHLNSVFVTINRKYKLIKEDRDYFLKRKSGKESKWCAIDTGKIVVHLFLPEYREYYDLECLWACGSEFDEKYSEFKQHRSDIEQKLTFIEVDESKN